MAIGTVKWFNSVKGYGFIQPDEGGADVFVHITALEKAGLQTLNDNQRIEFDRTENRGKVSATELKLID